MKLPSYFKNLLKFMRAGGVVYSPVSFVNAGERFEDKVVLITGGSTGIGFVTARCLISEGAKVIITVRNEECLQESAKQILSERLKYVVWDISDVSSFESKLKDAISLFGKIDIFINADVIKYESMDEYDEDTYDYLLDTNTKVLFFMCQAEGNYLVREKKRGKILNVCSLAGVDAQFNPYSISDWGSICITKGLAKELVNKGVIINGVALDYVQTKVYRCNKEESNEKICEQEDIIEKVAYLLLFLASDSTNSIIGQVITVDGGYCLH